MRTIPIALALMLAPFTAQAPAENGPSPILYTLQEETPRPPEQIPKPELQPVLTERTNDLWYAMPGVRPGGDLIGPITDLVRKPSGLLDVKPRKVPSYLPDRETAEFLRERR
jgi:hypothetical protein